jgi:hypothetical protein
MSTDRSTFDVVPGVEDRTTKPATVVPPSSTR